MGFRTKIDYSSNRQTTQHIETTTVLSGSTQFGVLFSQLPTGPNSLISGSTIIGTNLISTFSGNSATTIFYWYDNRMELAHTRLSAITPTNSATTQQTGNIFTANTSTTIDGNIVNLTYSGVNFDLTTVAMSNLGSGNYSGTVNSLNVLLLTAGTIDFTGRTIWCDVSGITRTNDLIVNKSPTIGYVWTCSDAEGKGIWSALGTGATNYWSGGSGSNAIVMNKSNSISSGINSVAEGYLTTASANYAHAEGSGTTASGGTSHAQNRNCIAGGIASHAGGSGSYASGLASFVHSTNSTVTGARSAILGGQNISGASNDTVYVPDFVLKPVAAIPTTSSDPIGNIGSFTFDTNYLYVKTITGWGRLNFNYAW